jgi:PAS domain S-box-containing protein
MIQKPTYEELAEKVQEYEKAEQRRRTINDRLQARAETIVSQNRSDGYDNAPYSKQNLNKIINELQIHQVELEIQNEELRKTQLDLSHAKNRLFSLFHQAPVGYAILDHAGIILDINKTLCDMVAGHRSDLLGKPFPDLIVPADKGVFYARYLPFFKNPEGKFMELQLSRKKRDDFDVQLEGRLLTSDEKVSGQKKEQLFVAVTDITRRKQAEKREHHIQNILRAIRNISQMITTETDRQRLIEKACENLTEAMGYNNAWIALLDERWENIIMTASSGFKGGFSVMQNRLDQGWFADCMKKALQQTGLVVVENPALECRDCPFSAGYDDSTGFVQRLEFEGQVFGTLSVSVARAYAGLTREQDLFREVVHDLSFALHTIEITQALRQAYTIIERSPAVAFVWQNSQGWPVEFVSENCGNILGWEAGQFLSQQVSYAEIIHPDDLDRVFLEVSSNSADQVSTTVDHQPYRIRWPNGSIRWVEDMTFIRRNKAGKITHYEGIVKDITERKKMEKQLLQVEKGESLSRMAGAVAHHFNNILMITIGYLDMVQGDIPQGSETADSIKEAARAAHRAVALSQLMLTYLGQGVRKNEKIDFSELCRIKLKDLAKAMPENIRLSTQFAFTGLMIQSDRSHLEQVLNILFENAVEALAEKTSGKISVTLEPAETSDIQYVHMFPNNWRAGPEAYARLVFSDTGKGMAEETIPLIFDPFYSDKFTGRGMGLAVALGIVKAHGGCICVQSKAGEGTDFVIFLPLSTMSETGPTGNES